MSFHYVPVLKGKKAEYDALAELPTSLRKDFTPLVEVATIPEDPKTKKPKKTVDQHLGNIGLLMKKAFGTTHPVFVDTTYLTGSFASDGTHPLSALGKVAFSRGIKFIPVTGLNRDEKYQKAAQAITQEGLCLRLNGGDIVDPESNFKDVVEKFLGEFKMRPSQIDLVLDFRAIPRNIDPRIFALAVKSAITATPFIGDWRTFTLIESSFPEQLSSDFGFTADEISTASRTEWHIWKYLRTQSAEIARMPAFGDYGVFHPDPTAFDFIRMQMAAKIRYTSDEHWLIVKGRSTKDKGFEQYMKLAKMLIDHPEYKGRKFSPGDEYIYTRGNKSPGATCGNQTTWIEAGVSHHIAFVLHQLANLDAA
jgi:hypothetical protein